MEEMIPDKDTLEQAIAMLCYQNGGKLKLPAVPDELIERDFMVTAENTEDGGIEFTVHHRDIQ